MFAHSPPWMAARHRLLHNSIVNSLLGKVINSLWPGDAYVRQWTTSSMAQVMAVSVLATLWTNAVLLSVGTNLSKFESDCIKFHKRKWIWKCRLQNGTYFVSVSMRVHCIVLGPLWLTWINFNTAWISNDIHFDVWDEITYPFPNFNDGTVEVWECINNFIPYFTGHAFTYPCWN